MARAGPRTVHKYSDEFKLAAVRLSHEPGIQVKTVAAALAIHPFMLSKWRKAVREGVLRAPRLPRVTKPSRTVVRELAYLEELERKYAALQEEHALRKKPCGSLPRERRPLRVHRQRVTPDGARSVPRSVDATR